MVIGCGLKRGREPAVDPLEFEGADAAVDDDPGGLVQLDLGGRERRAARRGDRVGQHEAVEDDRLDALLGVQAVEAGPCPGSAAGCSRSAVRADCSTSPWSEDGLAGRSRPGVIVLMSSSRTPSLGVVSVTMISPGPVSLSCQRFPWRSSPVRILALVLVGRQDRRVGADRLGDRDGRGRPGGLLGQEVLERVVADRAGRGTGRAAGGSPGSPGSTAADAWPGRVGQTVDAWNSWETPFTDNPRGRRHRPIHGPWRVPTPGRRP